MPPQYCAERYVWRFDEGIIASCQMLNILLDNFPYSFNPLSVLDIDMFTMTEEKLQDSLTKTMSVAFEVTPPPCSCMRLFMNPPDANASSIEPFLLEYLLYFTPIHP